MDPAEHQRFTRRIVDALARDARVVGVVALGSTAGGADRHSDHDLFVVAVAGHAEALRATQEWLPDPQRIVLALRETAHGLKVVWDDGHLAEYAVFEPGELALARAERRWRVLLDRADVAARMAAIERATGEALQAGEPGADWHLGQFLTQLLVGVARWQRGERLSARQFVTRAALAHLVPLLSGAPVIDPLRRFEERHPEHGAALGEALRRDPPEAASALLDLARRALPADVTARSAAAFDAVRRRVALSAGG
jgi:hypothetical protein